MTGKIPRLTIAIGVVASSCSGTGDISAGIEKAVSAGPGSRIALSDLAPFHWDKVCVFGPYTPDDEVDRITAVPGAAAHAYDIRSNDGADVLMFIAGDRVARSVAHARSRGDFGPDVVGRCYPPAQAVFSVRVPAGRSWGNIGPRKDGGG